jgi:hypothetical protein
MQEQREQPPPLESKGDTGSLRPAGELQALAGKTAADEPAVALPIEDEGIPAGDDLIAKDEPPTPELLADIDVSPAEPAPPVHLDSMLRRLAIALLLLIIIINIPFNRYGTNLARAMPDAEAFVIRDGVLLKGSGPEVYTLENNQRRWITTLDAFEWYGYTWEQVHEVEDSFLENFEEGLPVHLLLKCPSSPHVYALEDGQKRWIKDIPTFEAQQYVWEDIKFVTCQELRDIPNGPPIPPDAGTPPQP